MKIILKGEPKSTQHCYKYTCRGNYASMYMDQKCKDIKEAYMYEAIAQFKQKILAGPVQVGMKIYFGTKRKCDIDNFNKLVFDALSGVVWRDDSQIEELHIKKLYDKENPRVELLIYETEEKL